MKGILFKPDMIEAIVEGRKTVTRRLPDYPRFGKYKSKESDWDILPLIDNRFYITSKDGIVFDSGCGKLSKGMQDHVLNPRYLPGETVYIKEAWKIKDAYIGTPNDFGIVYSDGEIRWWVDNGGEMNYPINENKKHSPMFLPEKFARYFIKIKDVRPERLQEITDEDAELEGCTTMVGVTAGGSMGLASARYAYMKLWDSLNKKTPWASNPWVWRIEFERVEVSR